MASSTSTGNHDMQSSMWRKEVLLEELGIGGNKDVFRNVIDLMLVTANTGRELQLQKSVTRQQIKSVDELRNNI